MKKIPTKEEIKEKVNFFNLRRKYAFLTLAMMKEPCSAYRFHTEFNEKLKEINDRCYSPHTYYLLFLEEQGLAKQLPNKKWIAITALSDKQYQILEEMQKASIQLEPDYGLMMKDKNSLAFSVSFHFKTMEEANVARDVLLERLGPYIVQEEEK